jgi:hypothetical protein
MGLVIEVPSLCEVLFLLLLPDFNLLIFPASTKFIASELVLSLVLLTTMFRNKPRRVAHDEWTKGVRFWERLMMMVMEGGARFAEDGRREDLGLCPNQPETETAAAASHVHLATPDSMHSLSSE